MPVLFQSCWTVTFRHMYVLNIRVYQDNGTNAERAAGPATSRKRCAIGEGLPGNHRAGDAGAMQRVVRQQAGRAAGVRWRRLQRNGPLPRVRRGRRRQVGIAEDINVFWFPVIELHLELDSRNSSHACQARQPCAGAE